MLVKIGLFLFQMQDQSMNQNPLLSSVGTLIIPIPNEADHHWKIIYKDVLVIVINILFHLT